MKFVEGKSRLMLLGLTILACVGCTTISSTMLNRTDGDSFYRNSKTRGVPIRLKVDSHVDVFIEEQFLLRKVSTSNSEFNLVEVDLPGRHLSVRTEIVQSDKVFTVDFKRPGAGTLEYEAKFNDDYYFSNINNQLEDNTIEKTADLAATVGSLFGISTTGDESEDGETDPKGDDASGDSKNKDNDPDQALNPKVGTEVKNLFPQRRVVAYKRFDLDDPCFEENIRAFVDLHLNACGQCELNDQYQTPPPAFPAPHGVNGNVVRPIDIPIKALPQQNNGGAKK